MSAETIDERRTKLRNELSHAVGRDRDDDWYLDRIIDLENEIASIRRDIDKPEAWTRKLTMLVGECIMHQRHGYDVLASACWDDVCRHWAEGENKA